MIRIILLALLICTTPSLAFAQTAQAAQTAREAPNPTAQLGKGCYYNDTAYTVGASICISQSLMMTCQSGDKGWSDTLVDKPACLHSHIK